MSHREASYKFKGKASGRNVDNRVKDKRLESKKKRDELVSNKRGVLCDLNLKEKEEEEIKAIRTNKRREELVKWKKERDERKQKEKLQRKPTFMPAGSFPFKPALPSSSKQLANVTVSKCNTTIKEPVTERVVRKSTRIANRTQSSLPSKIAKIPTKDKNGSGLKSSSSKKKPAKAPPPTKSCDSHVTKKTLSANELIKNDDKSIHDTKSHDSHVTVVEKENIRTCAGSDVLTAAWIPGATVATTKLGRASGFEKTFFDQCFSPFKFGGKDNPKNQFTFRKELMTTKPPSHETSFEDADNVGVVTTPPTQDKHVQEEEDAPQYTGLSDNSIEAINLSVAHNNDYTNKQVLLEEEQVKMNKEILGTSPVNVRNVAMPITPPINIPLTNKGGSPTVNKCATPINNTLNLTSTTSSNVDSKKGDLSLLQDDLRPYYQRHADVTVRFTNLCQVWNDKLVELETQQVRPSDEVMDDIRTTVCSAQLLMRQKLKQYLDLVKLAEDPKAEHKTVLDDLQGFWDMVYFQVEKIDKKFNSFQEMETNNWSEPLVVAAAPPTKTRRSKRRASEVASSKLSSSTKSAPPTERQLAARAKREAARMKLKQLKLAAARDKEEKSEEKKEEEEKEETNEELSAPKTPKRGTKKSELPDLISFSPAPPSSPPSVYKTPRSTRSSSKKKQQAQGESSSFQSTTLRSEVEEMQGAFVTKIVQLNVSKKMMGKYDTDVIMSPARRSKRLEIQQERKHQLLNSMTDL